MKHNLWFVSLREINSLTFWEHSLSDSYEITRASVWEYSFTKLILKFWWKKKLAI